MRLAFETRRGDQADLDIFAMNLDGSELTRLTEDINDDQAPVWSPDGSRVAWMSWRTGIANIFVMGADGEAETQITNDESFAGYPMWSARNKIAFVSARDIDNEIYVINPDGTGEVNLTNNHTPSGDFDGYHAWSPDGTRMVFSSNRDSCIRDDGTTRPNCQDLYTMKDDGTDIRRLTSDFRIELAPSWSPDGTKIAFVGDKEAPYRSLLSSGALGDIYVLELNPDGSPGATRRLTTTMDVGFPAWSPDGKIVFVRDTTRLQSLGTDIYLMDADGSNMVPLVSSVLDDTRPWFSPAR